MSSLAIGIDVGGTSLRAALVERDGVIVRSAKRALVGRSPAEMLDQLTLLVESLAPVPADAPMAVGFAALLLPREGLVAVGPAFGWRDVPIGALLAQRFGRPVRLVNDLDAITVGEAMCGAGRQRGPGDSAGVGAGSRDLMCVFVGTGVGMGVVSQGTLVEGADGLATELGHTKIESPTTGRPCGCGERGCLEAYTSGSHLPKLLAEKVATGLASPLFAEAAGDPSRVNARTLEGAAAVGDPAACALWEDIAARLGTGIANAVTLFNPRLLVLGGGVLLLAPSLRARVVTRIREAVARAHLARLEICDTRLGDEAGVIGAGLLAHDAARPALPG